MYAFACAGEIPHEIGRLQLLRTLQLQHNNLIGEIPESMCEMKKLHKLSLRGNCMSGQIPYSIGRMTSLVFLSLRNNEFSGAHHEFLWHTELPYEHQSDGMLIA